MTIVNADTGEVVGRSLVECEAVIERGLGTFVEVGEALLEIREQRLYRMIHGDFDTYCRDRWGFSRRRAGEFIEAADVVNRLGEISPSVAPTREAHAAALTPLRDDPEAMAEVMDEVGSTGDRVTAEKISEKVAEKLTERVREAQDLKAQAEADAAEFEALHPADFDPVVNKELIRQRGELSRLCRDLVAIGDQADFVARHGDQLRDEHCDRVVAASDWLLALRYELENA